MTLRRTPQRQRRKVAEAIIAETYKAFTNKLRDLKKSLWPNYLDYDVNDPKSFKSVKGALVVPGRLKCQELLSPNSTKVIVAKKASLDTT